MRGFAVRITHSFFFAPVLHRVHTFGPLMKDCACSFFNQSVREISINHFRIYRYVRMARKTHAALFKPTSESEHISSSTMNLISIRFPSLASKCLPFSLSLQSVFFLFCLNSYNWMASKQANRITAENNVIVMPITVYL